MTVVGRNDPCPCGSGKKYKRCCLNTDGGQGTRRSQLALWSAATVVVVALIVSYFFGRQAGVLTGVTGLLAIGGYLLFTDPPPPKSGGNPGAINFGS